MSRLGSLVLGLVIVLLTITCDRLMRIRSPFSRANLTTETVNKVMLGVWAFVFVIAVVPVLPSSYFRKKFYAR